MDFLALLFLLLVGESAQELLESRRYRYRLCLGLEVLLLLYVTACGAHWGRRHDQKGWQGLVALENFLVFALCLLGLSSLLSLLRFN